MARSSDSTQCCMDAFVSASNSSASMTRRIRWAARSRSSNGSRLRSPRVAFFCSCATPACPAQLPPQADAPVTFPLLIICYLLIMSPVSGQGRACGRSMVIARQGIAATSQVPASQSAAQILARGGSAVDAAIAANAVLAVLEPMKCGLGGDLFVLHWEAATGKLTGLNASGPAPRSLSPDYLAAKGFEAMPQE